KMSPLRGLRFIFNHPQGSATLHPGLNSERPLTGLWFIVVQAIAQPSNSRIGANLKAKVSGIRLQPLRSCTETVGEIQNDPLPNGFLCFGTSAIGVMMAKHARRP